MRQISDSPPRAPPIKYSAPFGTRWAKEKAAAGGSQAFDLPTDPRAIGPWILGECVGKGASGRVKIAKHRFSGQLAAVKILPITPLVNSRASLATQQAKSDKQRLGIDREITMMKLMNHPNILRIYDVFESDKELFLVLEYVEEALQIFRQIVYGLNYAHTFSIIHRDLKPENILIASLSPPLIKIADWGMAAFAPPSLQLETSCGSPHYASPEIVNGEKYQGNATDIWSCGVILYALLTGRLPFDDKNVRTLLSKVKSGKYEMPAWIDPLAKDLLSKMLVVDVKQRITIPDILSHPWVTAKGISSSNTTGIFNLSIPPLPPSPSILARPIKSTELIDRELLSSLRIIWGRHTDANGESIKKDLCSPVGEGVYAKAFYFLLSKYREESSKTRGMETDTDIECLDRADFNLGWELDQSGTRPYDMSRSSILAMQRSAAPTLPFPIPGGRATTEGGTLLHDKPVSLVGPRPPPRYANKMQGIGMKQTEGGSSTLTSVVSNITRPPSALGSGRGGPRPHPLKRGYSESAAPREYAYHGVDLTWKPLQSQSKSPQAVLLPTFPRWSRTNSPTGLPRINADRPATFSSFGRPPTDLQDAASLVDDPQSRIEFMAVASSPPVLDAIPDTSISFDLDPTLDELKLAIQHADGLSQQLAGDRNAPVPELLDASSCIVIGQNVNETLPDVEVEKRDQKVTLLRKLTLKSTGENDKENQSVGKDSGWTYIVADEGKSGGIGLGVGRDIGNIGNVAPKPLATKTKKEKEKKGRPPPIQVPPVRQKRPALSMLGSPINYASPVYNGPGSTNRILGSPAVGEFKDWFTNLFNWKIQSSVGGTLYSISDVPKTCRDIGRLFRSLGVLVEGMGDMSNIPDHSLLGRTLRCRVEQASVDLVTNIHVKPVRFKVEVSPSPPALAQSSLSPLSDGNSGNSQSLGNAPMNAIPPSLGNAPRGRLSLSGSAVIPAEYLCSITLVYEKGSMSTFKILWKRVRDTYREETDAYPCLSPVFPNTPVGQIMQRG